MLDDSLTENLYRTLEIQYKEKETTFLMAQASFTLVLSPEEWASNTELQRREIIKLRFERLLRAQIDRQRSRTNPSGDNDSRGSPGG